MRNVNGTGGLGPSFGCGSGSIGPPGWSHFFASSLGASRLGVGSTAVSCQQILQQSNGGAIWDISRWTVSDESNPKGSAVEGALRLQGWVLMQRILVPPDKALWDSLNWNMCNMCWVVVVGKDNMIPSFSHKGFLTFAFCIPWCYPKGQALKDSKKTFCNWIFINILYTEWTWMHYDLNNLKQS